jgi:hypothetical protein
MPKKSNKRSKKYNPRKSAPTQSSMSLRAKGLAVWFSCDKKHARVVHVKQQRVFDPDPETASQISNFPHKWSYTLVVYCRNAKKEEYIVTGVPNLADEKGTPLWERRLNQANLAEALDTAHKDFLAKLEHPDDVVNTGWIAFPYKASIDEFTICTIADKENAWGFPSKREAKIITKKKEISQTVAGIDSIKRKSLPKLG